MHRFQLKRGKREKEEEKRERKREKKKEEKKGRKIPREKRTKKEPGSVSYRDTSPSLHFVINLLYYFIILDLFPVMCYV